MGSKARSLSALFLSPSISLSEAIMSFKFKGFTTLSDDSRCSTFEEPMALNSEAPSTSSLQPLEDLNSGKNVSAMPWFSNMSSSDLSSQRKEVSRMIDQRIPIKNLNELNSVLVYSLASCGRVHDALRVYNEIKHAGFPKAVINLIEHLRIDGELTVMLQLLDELKDRRHWIDGCCRVVLYCVLHKHFRSAIDLLRQYNNYFCEDDFGMRIVYDEVFCFISELDPTYLELDPTYIEFGLELLQVIKCEFGRSPTRTSLRFLLSACGYAKDLDKAQMIWKEYQSAGYSYDIISLLRMYQVLLECGDLKSAKLLLRKMPKTDLDVQLAIKQSEAAFSEGTQKKKTATTQK